MDDLNCFTFLGLDPEHRAKPVQLVKHREEVPESKLTFPVYGQVKRDGIFCMLIVLPNKVGIFGRTGKKLSSTEGLEFKFHQLGLQQGVYFGELQTSALVHLEALSGVVNPNRTEGLDFIQEQTRDGLYIDFFDMMTIQGFIDGKSDVTFKKRYDALHRRLEVKLWGDNTILPVYLINSELEAEAFADEWIKQGEEGAVFKLDCDWEAGHKGYRQTKIVRKVSFDLTCIGWEEGKGKYEGKVANLIFKWKGGKAIKAMLGKGYTHADAERMYHDIKHGGELNVIGKIFAVSGLMESSKGVIRLPKVGELRHDKSEPDVI